MRSNKLKSFLFPTFSQPSSCGQGNRAGDLRSALTASRPVNVARTTERKLIMSATTLIATLLMMLPVHAETQAHRLIAKSVVINDAFYQTDLGEIWSDRKQVLDTQANLIVKIKRKIDPSFQPQIEIFTASFETPEGVYIISAPNSGCTSLPSDDKDHSAYLSCYARLSLKTKQGISLVASEKALIFASVRGHAGYDETSNSQDHSKTMISFDTDKKLFSYETFTDGIADSSGFATSQIFKLK
jgi:hypothetical protein